MTLRSRRPRNLVKSKCLTGTIQKIRNRTSSQLVASGRVNITPAELKGRMSIGSSSNKLGNAALILGAVVFSVLVGEAFARIADGRWIFDGPAYFGTPQYVAIDDYVARIEATRESVGDLWRRLPAPLENRREPSAQDLQRMNEFGDNPIDTQYSGQVTTAELFKVWNSKLVEAACTHDVLKHLTRWPFDYFLSPDNSDRPRYRYRPNATLPTGLVTNQIGWRGKPIVARGPETIRIVFIGASTIAEGGVVPWSAPELIEEWLNRWASERRLRAQFQVLNAGREGAMTPDVAAIVRDEIVPLRPDLVIFYEGALQFDWSSTVPNAGNLKSLPRPRYSDQVGWLAEMVQRSSLFAHILTALSDAGISIGNVGESEKPKYEIVWPKGLDEKDPDITRKDLPLNLSLILSDLDQIRVELSKAGIEFAISSLDPVKGRYIWEVNNRGYWPWTYRDIRHGLDFENQVYSKFASAHGLPFFDVASLIPSEPLLFSDGVHMTQSGVRVKAWAFFREMLPLIEQRLATGAWPRAISDGQLPTFEVKRRAVHCN
jgi:hypothetical protein